MNERIKELAEQAGEWYMNNSKEFPSPQEWNEKFAELLVQKCVYISDDYVKDCTCEEHIDCKHPRSAIGRKIREYFGVK